MPTGSRFLHVQREARATRTGERLTCVSWASIWRAAAVPLFVLVGALYGCEPSDGVHLVIDIIGPDGDPTSNQWLGTVKGDGQGMIARSTVMTQDVYLVIQRDADSVRFEECLQCVTAQRDTVFTQINAHTLSLISLDTGCTAGGVQRSVRLDRYGAGGAIGNVVNSRLALSGGVTGTVKYVLQRR